MKLKHEAIREIKFELRKALKAGGYSYKDVSNLTGLSYLKVRRIMTSQEIKLNELLLIFEVIEIDFKTMVKEATKARSMRPNTPTDSRDLSNK